MISYKESAVNLSGWTVTGRLKIKGFLALDPWHHESVTGSDIEKLRSTEGRTVELHCSDGEVLVAKILHIDDEYQDVIYDLVRSTAHCPFGATSAYVVPLANFPDFKEIPS
jgi:hypothetical protein